MTTTVNSQKQAGAVGTMSEREITLRTVTVIAAAVIALAFLFGFGNVFDLAVRLGVPIYVAPLVAPAVDLSVLGLLVGVRYLSAHGARVAVAGSTAVDRRRCRNCRSECCRSVALGRVW